MEFLYQYKVFLHLYILLPGETYFLLYTLPSILLTRQNNINVSTNKRYFMFYFYSILLSFSTLNYAFSPIAVYMCGSAERRLLNDLMASYQKLERPVYNETEPVFSVTQKYLASDKKYLQVILKFGLTLQQIMDVVRNII